MVQMKNKQTKKPPEKEINEIEMRNLSDAEFKTLVIRMSKELTEYDNSIKKIQAEMKFTFIEIKTNLQGTNSGRDEAEFQINNLEHQEEINIHPEQQEEKEFKKETRIV